MKKISIEHLTRIEGNGGISATIDGKVVTDVQFKINEGPRLIERLTVGRTPDEDVSIAPRICAICSCSHKNAVLRAMETALDVQVSPHVYHSRELMHMGEMIESHSLHTFLLALPDFLGYPNAIAMAADYGFEAKIGLEMKNFGNRIMELYNARFIHGENAVIGGFGKYPTLKDLLWIKARAQQFMPFVHKTVSLFCELDYPDIPEEETLYACCEPGNETYGFWGNEILLSNGKRIDRDDYKSLTNEFLVPHSYAKRSRYEGKPFSVGALARVNILGGRLKGETGKMYAKYFGPRWKKNPLFHAAAQALEIVYCFERIPELVDILVENGKNPPLIKPAKKDGKGTGLVEAPRGLLIHHYEIKNGLVQSVDITTPTAINAEEIERYCHIAAQKLLDDGQEDKIKSRLDIVVRAFDPCISCSAHTVEVRMAAADGWKKRLEEIKAQGNPVFVGVGNADRSDDAAGLEMALELRSCGHPDVWLQSELLGGEDLWEKAAERPVVFLDTIDFRQSPGKVTLIPLHRVIDNASFSHRFVPFLWGTARPGQLKNSFILGVQPESTDFGHGLSPRVRRSMSKVLAALKG